MTRLVKFPSYLVLTCAVVLMILSITVFAQQSSAADSYRLGPGDWIVIDVFGEDDLSMDVMLNDTGIIDYPFLGEVAVAGLTVGELEAILLRGLKGPYLVDPDITVAIKQYRSIYVSGEVKQPGAFPYQPGMTVEKAIAMAGGFTERASRNKLQVKRASTSPAKPTDAQLTDSIHPGDVIFVKQSFF